MSAPIEEAIRALSAEFAVAMGSASRVAAACQSLRAQRDAWGVEPDASRLQALAPLLSTRADPLALTLFDLIEELAAAAAEPWPFLLGMLKARTPDLVGRAVDAAIAAGVSGRLAAGDELAREMGALAADPVSPLLDAEILPKVARLLQRRLPELFLGAPDVQTRRLAAAILDLDGRPPSPAVSASVLGRPAYAFLAPYLDYTRATHMDLLHLAPRPGEPPIALSALREADARCGAPLLRAVLSSIGWRAVSRGIEVRRWVGLSIDGSYPLQLTPAEAAIFNGCPGAFRAFDRTLVIAHGGGAGAGDGAASGDERVSRFRASNLLHAKALADFLDLAPLTRERVAGLLSTAGQLVAAFTDTFASEREECAAVAGAWDRLRGQIEDALAGGATGVSAELSRLVQPFEDPKSASEVRSLHGLKRYLHQRGLRLGFRLVEPGRHTTRTVALVVAEGDRVLRSAAPLEYADFEPDPAATPDAPPYAVRVVVDGLARQMLHGTQSLPAVRMFCYGNEVHHFISFRNHPAFVRVDYSPPVSGGMIDLEYYGVSKYELSHHPNVSLDGLRTFLRRLDFDVDVENTRVHVRYDKERALDVADLCARAEALFRLAPYLMDIDWVIGQLDLGSEARRTAAAAWADFFACWGVLPLEQILTRDRRGILAAIDHHPEGPRERAWRGDGAYEDRVSRPVPPAAAQDVRAALLARGVALPPFATAAATAQIAMERQLLTPLRDAVGRGELFESADGFHPRPAHLFRKPHEAVRLARILAGDAGTLEASARLAQAAAAVERACRFRTIGHINGYDVEHADVVMAGSTIGLSVLRDGDGAARVALFTEGPELIEHRGGEREGWQDNASCDSARFVSLLRRGNFALADLAAAHEPAQALRAIFRVQNARPPVRRLAGELALPGVRAAPGRASGPARLGTERRNPADLDGCVLVTNRLQPDDSAFLIRSSGVVCTGGGVLSHAGLLASQFRRPALVVAGEWTHPRDGPTLLRVRVPIFDETEEQIGDFRVSERHYTGEQEETIRDGDLVELSAEEGIVRFLGQERDTVALHDGLSRLASADARLAAATAAPQVLVERGQRTHAVHQLQRLLNRIERPALVAHAVRELLLRSSSGAHAGRHHPELLRVLFDSPAAGVLARRCADEVLGAVARLRDMVEERALSLIPAAEQPFEVVARRLSARRHAATLKDIERALGRAAPSRSHRTGLDEAAARRLFELRGALGAELRRAVDRGDRSRARHLLDALERQAPVIPALGDDSAAFDRARAAIESWQRAAIERCRDRFVVGPQDGGWELAALAGAKASNLAEMTRVDPAVMVPPWFAITALAFRAMLRAPAGGATLDRAIEGVLARADLDDGKRARAIAALWEDASLPPDLAEQIRAAYRRLEEEAAGDRGAPRDGAGRLLVAVRSSAYEEDTAAAARAGDFDTFLFVSGEDAVVEHVKRAWAGYWTARAMHNRAVMGIGSRQPGGGVIVQRIIEARAAGVVQTVNVADDEPGQLVINAAFGLGEGVVSGAVAADHVVVDKLADLRAPLRLRYASADKRQRVVRNAALGRGTLRVDTLYHQRMRPALEYPELVELVATARRLERAYAQPLDLEFALDEARLWMLQARPLPPAAAAWQETAERYPLEMETTP
ncbi:MAG TPA: PEP/pyruvate-binding domain-containing protein [Vicinamibacterales bacterium]|nr:PEP/pyruvate-binding domain-containing protein [Vicinamibacterales bacterium]